MALRILSKQSKVCGHRLFSTRLESLKELLASENEQKSAPKKTESDKTFAIEVRESNQLLFI